MPYPDQKSINYGLLYPLHELSENLLRLKVYEDHGKHSLAVGLYIYLVLRGNVVVRLG